LEIIDEYCGAPNVLPKIAYDGVDDNIFEAAADTDDADTDE